MLRSLKFNSDLLSVCFPMVFALVVLTGISVATAKDHKEYRVGVDGTYPPFSHKTIDGKYIGYDIDLARTVCKSMKAKCTLIDFKWSNLLAAVRGNKVDFVVATIGITDARRELVNLSDAYLQIPSAVVVRKDSILSGIGVEDLRDAQFGVLKSSPHGEYIRVHHTGTHIKPYDNQDEYYVDLTNRRLDGIVGNPILLNTWLQTADGNACCRMLGTLPHDRQINGAGYAIAVDKNSQELLEQINKALGSITKSGQKAKILRAHLPFLNSTK